MNTLALMYPQNHRAIASTREADSPFSSEVLLRTGCVVEYTAKLNPIDSDAAARQPAPPLIEAGSDVILTVYVRRCMLNPTRVRIVEV
jgi:hypothetical protein